MADQATLIGHNGSAGPAAGDPGPVGRPGAASGTEAGAGQMMSNVAGFGENLLNLAELQARMTAVELRQNVAAVKAAAAVLVLGGLIALATLPVILAGIAELFVSELGWRRGYAFLAVGSTAMGIAAFCRPDGGRPAQAKATGVSPVDGRIHPQPQLGAHRLALEWPPAVPAELTGRCES